MSLSQIYKLKITIGFLAGIFLLNHFSVCAICAQEIEAKIKIVSFAAERSQVHIEGKLLYQKQILGQNLSFLHNYADVSNLGERIENLNLFDKTLNKNAPANKTAFPLR